MYILSGLFSIHTSVISEIMNMFFSSSPGIRRKTYYAFQLISHHRQREVNPCTKPRKGGGSSASAPLVDQSRRLSTHAVDYAVHHDYASLGITRVYRIRNGL